jgi:hypothetical protein
MDLQLPNHAPSQNSRVLELVLKLHGGRLLLIWWRKILEE